MNTQNLFWRELYSLKSHANYLSRYLENTERTDRRISIALAVFSTSSLGLWAALKQFEMLWAGIIVLTQIAQVVRKYLPYAARLKALFGATHEFEEHLIWAEEKWHHVASGGLTGEEIINLRMEIQKRVLKAMRTHFKDVVLPRNLDLMAGAEADAQTYFSNYYSENENDQS